MIDPIVLARIARRASSLAERLAAGAIAGRDSRGDGRAAEQFARWTQTVAPGAAEVLRKRLRWDGLDEELVRQRLAPPDPGSPGELPRWTGVLTQIVDAALQYRGVSAGPARIPREDLPSAAAADPPLPVVAGDP